MRRARCGVRSRRRGRGPPAPARSRSRATRAGAPGSGRGPPRAAGARPAGLGAIETLRIEAGRPRFGADLTEDVIPTEAFEESGLMERAISFTKGCYTGQEVIIRIAHRGHVNKHLRGLLLGDAPAPAPGTRLVNAETGKDAGWLTSVAHSPMLGQAVALGYVRREVEPGAAVRLGATDGAAATVVRLPFERPA